ncbi:MAG: C4-dicarboxylate ABC transporter [Thermonema sp.]|uniref:TRAP transporter substrate-binding protein n=1 Tax=Thermonema sp. TaxID=2231181 RepID=UPI0021DEF42B|nr:TRAP transporter substrate-binding protein DctP [Thermonema sp.]GIV38288.1 MAG: C4-dicarboxylate ABC transporter [Thermonema sp.]
MQQDTNKHIPPRRDFLKKSLQTLAAGSLLGLSACRDDLKQAAGLAQATETYNGESIEWMAATTWPPNFPILGEGVQLFAKQVEIMSAGRLKIKVYGGGELIPPLEVFDAVSNGSIQIGHGAAYYWSGKIPAANFFAAVPFGFNAQQMNAWLISGGGWQLWQEIYAPYNVIPFPAGNTGVQMGGWFNREINTPADLKGLKMRIPGLGGKVLDRMGGAAVQIAGSEIYTSLERGVIDAAEWIGPYHDYTLGFHKIARYYYYPGWHEPGATLELLVNKQAFESLPPSLQEIIRTAALRANLWMLSEFEAKNAEYLEKIISEGKVEVRPYPAEVLRALQNTTAQLLEELAAQDAPTKKVWEHVQAFKQKMNRWNQISESAILPYLQA